MKRPIQVHNRHTLDEDPRPWAGLVTSLHQEFDYQCQVEGQLPKLHGKLFRLGPGLYERGQSRKRMVLDGDGMIQEFSFQGGQVHYRNRFVRTRKFVNEEKENRFMYPTLSTHSSGPWYENLGITLPHQANITPLASPKRLLAFDESQKPYELDPDDLSTLGETELDHLNPSLRFWAHWKLDPLNQQIHFLSLQQGPVLKAQITSTDPDFSVKNRTNFTLPRASYFHDWFITKQFYVFVLHPAIVSLKTLVRVGLGLDTFSDALKWKPELGNIVCLIDRRTREQHLFETTACWMWHTVNGFDLGDEVILDFIGSENGGGLGDPNAPFYTIMGSEEVQVPKQTTNHLRRYQINPKTKKIFYHTLNQDGNFELPTVSAFQRGQSHNLAHFIQALPGEFFARSLAEWDQNKEQLSHYLSTGQEYFSEPLSFSSMDTDSDYISSLVYNGDLKKSYLGIFKKSQVAQGPIAKIWLKHHTPLGFHGFWLPNS